MLLSWIKQVVKKWNGCQRPAKTRSQRAAPRRPQRFCPSVELLEDRLAPAYVVGPTPNSPTPLPAIVTTTTNPSVVSSSTQPYYLQAGVLYQSTANGPVAVAGNVASFALGQSEVCYLQNNGNLFLAGNPKPIASGVTTYGIDGSGSIVYKESNNYLYLFNPGSQTTAQLGTNAVALFRMDGKGSAVALDQSGTLYRFSPGSSVTPPPLVQTTTDSSGNGTSVVTFAIDGSGDVVVLTSTKVAGNSPVGELLLFAPGSNTPQTLDTGVSKFAIDGAGTIVALDADSGPPNTATLQNNATVQLGNGQSYTAPVYGLVRFAPGAAPGSWVKQKIDWGVTTFVVDGAGSVVALDSLTSSEVTLASGQVYSVPTSTLARFAPGSTARQVIDQGVSQMALDGNGSVWVLDSLAVTTTITLANGQTSNSPVFRLAAFGPGATVPFTTTANVTRFVLDGAGEVVAGVNVLAFEAGTLPSGQVLQVPVQQLQIFANGWEYTAPYWVSKFAVDGSGTIVALDNWRWDTQTNTFVYDLVRLPPGLPGMARMRQVMQVGVSGFVLDGSGSVAALGNLSAGPGGITGQLTLFAPGSNTGQPMTTGAPVKSFAVDAAGSVVAVTSYGTLLHFNPGSTTGETMTITGLAAGYSASVSSFVVDGSGSVVALYWIHPGLFDTGTKDVIDLVRFAPGFTVGQELPIGSNVINYAVDGSGSVVALDAAHSLVYFSPGSMTAQTMSMPALPAGYVGDVDDFVVDGAGSVVARYWGHPGLFDTGTNDVVDLVRFAPDSTAGQELPISSNVANYAVDGSGSVIALDAAGGLLRFSPGSMTAQTMTMPGLSVQDVPFVSSFVVDGAGSVVALYSIHVSGVYVAGGINDLVRFAPGATTGQELPLSASVTNYALDDSGSIVAVAGNSLWYFWPGSNSARVLTDVASFVMDGSGAIFALGSGRSTLTNGQHAPSTVYTLFRYTPGNFQPTPVLSNVSNFTVDKTGSVVALDAQAQVLYRFASGSATPVVMNPTNSVVLAFSVDGAGNVVALTTSNSFNSLVLYAPGATTGVAMTNPYGNLTVTEFAVDKSGRVIALYGAGHLVYFPVGMTAAQDLDSGNQVLQFVFDGQGYIWAVERDLQGNQSLVRFPAMNATPSDRQPIDVTGGTGGNPQVRALTVCQGNIIVYASETTTTGWFIFQHTVYGGILVGFKAGTTTPIEIAGFIEKIGALADGSWLVLQSGEGGNGLLCQLSFANLDSNGFPTLSGPLRTDVADFTISADGTSYSVTNQGSQILAIALQDVEIIGALVVTVVTGGSGTPLLVTVLVGAGDQLLNQTINHFAFGSSFNLGSIGLGAFGSAIGAGGLDALESLGDAMGGVVGDITDAIGEGVDDFNQAVDGLIGNFVDPESPIGSILATSFDAAAGAFAKDLLTGQSLGQVALNSFEQSVLAGVVNSDFVQNTISFVNNTAADLVSDVANSTLYQEVSSLAQQGMELADQIVSDGLSNLPFGQEIGSFLGNVVQDYLNTGKVSLAQDALGFADQVLSDNLGNSPFAQEAIALINQAATNGVNSQLVNNLVSFLGQTAADGLMNSGVIQDGLSFLEQAVANGTDLAQSGLSFLQDVVANGLAGSNVVEQIGTFLQAVGAEDLNSLSASVSQGIDSFLQEAAQQGQSFLNSTFGQDVGAFLQAAGQNFNLLNSNLMSEVGSLLQQVDQAGAAFLNSPLAGEVGAFLDHVAAGAVTTFDTNIVPVLSQLSGTVGAASALGSQVAASVNQTAAEVGQFVDQVDQLASGSLVTFAGQATDLVSQIVGSVNVAASQWAAEAGKFLDDVAAGTVTTFDTNVLPVLNTLAAAVDAASGNVAVAVNQTAAEVGQFVDRVDQLTAGALANFAGSAVSLANQITGSVNLAGAQFSTEAGAFLDQVAAGAVTTFDTNVLPALNQIAATYTAASAQFASNVGQFVDAADQAITGTLADFANQALSLVQQIADSINLADSSFAQGVSQFLDQVVSNGLTASALLQQQVTNLSNMVSNGLANSPAAQGLLWFLNNVYFGGLTTGPFAGTSVTGIQLAANGTVWFTCGNGMLGTALNGQSASAVELNNVPVQIASLSLLSDGTARFVTADGELCYCLTGQSSAVTALFARDDNYAAMHMVAEPNTPFTPIAGYGLLANDMVVSIEPGFAQTVTLSAQLVVGPAHGQVTLNPNGMFTYTSNAGYLGPDTFTYRDTNGTYFSNVATVTLQVDVPPVAAPDAYSLASSVTNLSVSAANGVLANDRSPAGNPLTAVLDDGPSHGQLTLNPDGSFTYVRAAGYSGVDNFYYHATDGFLSSNMVQVTIGPAPMAGDVTYTFTVGSNSDSYNSATFDTVGVLRWASGGASGPLTAQLVSGPAHGTITLDPKWGTFVYTPDGTFQTTDSFTYCVSDGLFVSAPATVTLHINHLPVVNGPRYQVAANGTLTVSAAQGLLVAATDPNGNPLRIYGNVGQPGKGLLTANADGSFTYKPNAGFVGLDTFSYAVSDGVAFTESGPGFSWVEQPATPVYATATIVVGSVPVAAADAYSTVGAATLWVGTADGVLANDTDGNGNALQAVLVNGPSHGTLNFAADGSFSYTANAGFAGIDSFTYEARDGGLLSAPATVTLRVLPVTPIGVTVGPSPCTSGMPTVTWAATAGGSYDVARSADGGTSWTLVAHGVSGTSYTEPSPLSPGLYIYRVRTDDSAGDTSAFSAPSAVTVTDLAATGLSISLSEETPFSGAVASFRYTGSDPANRFTAIINWGDGSTDTGVTPTASAGVFTIAGTHTYHEEGFFAVTVTLTEAGNSFATATAHATGSVSDADQLAISAVPSLAATEGNLYSGPVAVFSDSNPQASSSDFTATITWGDGQSETGIVSGGSGTFTVSGSHVYDGVNGTLPVTVVLADRDTVNQITAIGQVRVADAPIVACALPIIMGNEFTLLGNIAVINFSHAGDEPASNFSASIAWGDGTTDTVASANPVTVSGGAGVYTVYGSHTYTDEGTYTITVTVLHNGAATTLTTQAMLAEELMPDGTYGSPLENYVAEAYRDVLGRAPDEAGLLSWSQALSQGLSRADFTNALTHSAEYYSQFITAAYQRYLGRTPDASGLAYWLGAMQNGLSDERLEAGFIGSAEYIASHGGPGAGWVTGMYRDLLGRTPAQAEVDGWVRALADGMAATQVAYGFAASPERETQRVAADYRAFLGRAPDAAGLANWVNGFVSGGLRNEDVVAGFAASDEYFAKYTG